MILIERLAVSASHPIWLIERWVKALGVEETEAFARANNDPAPVAFRVVKKRADETEVCDQLRRAGAILTPSRITNGAWRVTGGGILLAELAAQGVVYIQDEASQLVAAALGAERGDRVLDLCAAPGSKTTQIADAAQDAAMVVAADIHLHRLRSVTQTAEVQSLNGVNCVVLDGTRQLPFKKGVFDRVLVDAPCSGTGTLRRNPEIRWRISPEAFQDLSRRQYQLILEASEFVKPGGRLVYSTCSIESDENESVARLFLENRKDFSPAVLQADESLMTGPGEARTWPHRQDVDGFFISAFRRNDGAGRE